MRDILPESTLWLAFVAILILLHLTLHPQSINFRQSLQWIRKNPAPLFLLAASHTLLAGLQLWPGLLSHEVSSTPEHYQPLASPLEQWLHSCGKGWQHFTHIYHHAINPGPVFFHPVAGAFIQAFIAAASQIWLCRYFYNTLSPFVEDWLALRQLLALWPAIATLTLVYFSWWYLQRPGASHSNPWLRYLLLPQSFLLLAPIPLILATGNRRFSLVTHLAGLCFKNHFIPLCTITISGILMFTLLQQIIHHSQNGLGGTGSPTRIVIISLVASFLHLWIFLTTSFLLLRTLHQQDPQSLSTST